MDIEITHIIFTVLNLWENQRGGVSNVFLTYFDYFFGGVNTNLNLGARGTRGGLNPPTNRALNIQPMN